MSINTQEANRIRVITLFQAGKKLIEISKELSISYYTVQKIVSRYKKTGTTERLKGSGRTKKLSDTSIVLIKEKISKNPKLSLSKLNSIVLEKTGIVVSKETIRRELNLNNYTSRAAALKPLLTKKHIDARLCKALEWSRWPFRKLKQIVFSDESRFNLFNNDGRVRVWRLPNTRYLSKNCMPTVKGNNGSIMVWGAISYYGVGPLVVVDGNLNSVQYTRILSTHLHTMTDSHGFNDDFIFQQDNAPCHKSKHTMEFFSDNNINVMEWPAQSPDMNPIETCWAYVYSKLEKKVIKKKSELIEEILTIWYSIPISFIRKLYESFPKRIEMVINAKGEHIPY